MMHCQLNVTQGRGLFKSGDVNPESVTTLLSRVNGGEQGAFDLLVPLVYQELHRIAEGYLRRESQNHTLQPTALVHEAYLRLVDYSGTGYENRTHFYAIAARVRRQILVDHARARQAAKRGAAVILPLDERLDLAAQRDKTGLALDDALDPLASQRAANARTSAMRS